MGGSPGPAAAAPGKAKGIPKFDFLAFPVTWPSPMGVKGEADPAFLRYLWGICGGIPCGFPSSPTLQSATELDMIGKRYLAWPAAVLAIAPVEAQLGTGWEAYKP